MLLDDICDLLSSGGTTSDGTALFAGLMEETPERAVCVYETGGQRPYLAMTGTVGRVVAERPRIQVVARGAQMDYTTARLKINDCYRLLHNVGDRQINGVSYLWIAAVQSPFPMGKDENQRPLVAMNFDVVKAMSTA